LQSSNEVLFLVRADTGRRERKQSGKHEMAQPDTATTA
jgi:hypothetical protein